MPSNDRQPCADTIRTFGLQVDRPLAPTVDTPVGSECMHCDEVFVSGDAGFVLPHNAAAGSRDGAWHRACLLRNLFGSVGHIQGRCACYGGIIHDPPGLSRRNAAEAAAEELEAVRGGGGVGVDPSVSRNERGEEPHAG